MNGILRKNSFNGILLNSKFFIFIKDAMRNGYYFFSNETIVIKFKIKKKNIYIIVTEVNRLSLHFHDTFSHIFHDLVANPRVLRLLP